MPIAPPSDLRHAPDAATIEAYALDALASLPTVLRDAAAGVRLTIEEVAPDDVLRELGIEHPYDLTGLYHGRPLTEQSIMDTGRLADAVTLYRVPILIEWVEGGEELGHLVRHVLIHEIGHHFGFSDEDMHRLEAAAD